MGRITQNLGEVDAYFTKMLENEGCRKNPWVVSMAAKTNAAEDDLQDLNNTLTARMGNRMGAGHSPGSSSAATLTGGATDARGASESSPRLCVKLSESAESAPSSPSPRSTGSSPWEEAPRSLPPPSGLEPDQKRPRPWHQRRQPSPKSNPRFTVLPQRRWKAPNINETKFKASSQSSALKLCWGLCPFPSSALAFKLTVCRLLSLLSLPVL